MKRFMMAAAGIALLAACDTGSGSGTTPESTPDRSPVTTPMEKTSPVTPTTPETNTLVAKVKDPVCGMEVAKDVTFKTTFEGTDYYFCAEECMKKFKEDPKKFLTVPTDGAPSPKIE